MRAVLATALALAASLALAAGTSAASPIPGTLGLRLSPAPLALDDGERTLTAVNISGGLPLAVTLTASAGYAVEPATFTLAPDASQVITLTTVDPSSDGTLSAVAVAASPGGSVTSAIQLSTRLLHASFLERNPAVVPLLLLLALLLGLGLLVLVRRAVR
jgi:hypothetical protein